MIRPGFAYLQSKGENKERSHRAELRSFGIIVRRLNECCSKFGKQKSIKNGCVKCRDKEECVRLFDLRCEIHQ